MKRMSRRSFLARSAASAAALGLVGCGQGAATDDAVVSSSRLLNVLNWPDYLDLDLLATVDIELSYQINYRETWEDNYSGQDLFGPQWDIVTPTNWLAAQ